MESILPKYYLIKNDIIKRINNEEFRTSASTF